MSNWLRFKLWNVSTLALIACAATGFADEPNDSPNPVADESVSVKSDVEKKSNSFPPKKVAPKVSPEHYQQVDEAAAFLIWLVVACGLAGIVLLLVVVLGARRVRRLTRTPVLQSKYDELEYLRLRHRHEMEGLAPPKPPKSGGR